MKRRAEVWRDRSSRRTIWCAGVCHYRDRSPEPIHQRPDYMDRVRVFPTHAAALAHALAEVGLDLPAEHREAP